MTLEELCRFIGQTVTIFTTSGGASGCGFTGVLLRVNPCYVTLVNRLGTPPVNPLSDVICPDRRNGRDGRDGRECREGRDMDERPVYVVGSVCDIPVDKIAAFCHNAV
jgi:hypothetical protein